MCVFFFPFYLYIYIYVCVRERRTDRRKESDLLVCSSSFFIRVSGWGRGKVRVNEVRTCVCVSEWIHVSESERGRGGGME